MGRINEDGVCIIILNNIVNSMLPYVNAVINNANVISDYGGPVRYTGTRIGPDDKIYLNSGGNFLSRINNPDAYNVPCDLEIFAIDFRPLNTPYGALGIGSPTVVVPFCTPTTNGRNEYSISNAATISCYPNPAHDLLKIQQRECPTIAMPVRDLELSKINCLNIPYLLRKWIK